MSINEIKRVGLTTVCGLLLVLALAVPGLAQVSGPQTTRSQNLSVQSIPNGAQAEIQRRSHLAQRRRFHYS